MKASDFIYHRAASVAEAVQLLDDYDGGARILAGGQSLLPMMNMRLWRPAALIDINRVPDLATVEVQGEDTVVGALVRYETIETDPVFAARLPLLASMVRSVGDRQVRNRGTIGGSLVQGDPTGEMPLGALVLGARVRVRGVNGDREIPMEDFYEGSYAATLRPEEILTDIVFPKHPQHFAFRELCRRHNDFAVVSVAATGNIGVNGTWRNVRIGLGGVDDNPVVAVNAGRLLEGSTLSDADIAEAAALAAKAVSPPSDIRASREYRTHLISIYVQRVLDDLRSFPRT